MLVLAKMELIFFTENYLKVAFWICAEYSDDRHIFVIAKQGLHRDKACSAFCTAILMRKLGVNEKLGGDKSPKLTKGIFQKSI